MRHAKSGLAPRQRGVAAVEFALILPVIVILFAFIVFFGRLFWHYNVALKAASDVATFVSLARNTEMVEAKSDLGEIEIIKFARSIGEAEFAELNPGNDGRPVIHITCDGTPCIGEKIPDELIVVVRMRMYNAFFPKLLEQLGDIDGMWIHAEVRVRYAGT